jgi:hypothetical protein
MELMADAPTAVPFVDGASITRQQNSTTDNAGNVAPQTAIRTNGGPVEAGNAFPVFDQPHVITITTTIVPLTQADAQILPANPARKYLLIVNIGTGLATLGFGVAAVAGQGYPMPAASVAGDQGGGLERSGDGITQQAIHGVCAPGVTTTVCVLEGI